ncbi:helix-turn-helix domain-containing protein [Gillisia hiemivivida]|uniref:Helix-turn-helix domain-containing protein n=1 Tax=Gillisia hiemivivida TaxID=291190 RepID=A0A5C6ZUB8_9FLAO|nr:helix-turn-helix domain-containing protein [Gillisia hiemivivida]TXD93789.1 helix-turn-helix domain-containing protein [Gillisia hiemivivida]
MDDLQLEDRLIRIEQLLLANKEVLTLEEACQYTGISRSYMYKLTSTEKIPYCKPRGKLIYFEKEKLNSWLLNKSNS